MVLSWSVNSRIEKAKSKRKVEKIESNKIESIIVLFW